VNEHVAAGDAKRFNGEHHGSCGDAQDAFWRNQPLQVTLVAAPGTPP